MVYYNYTTYQLSNHAIDCDSCPGQLSLNQSMNLKKIVIRLGPEKLEKNLCTIPYI